MTDRQPNDVLSVVVIDDDPRQLDLIGRSLERIAESGMRLDVRRYVDPVEALADLPPEGRTVVLSDYLLAGGCALDWMPEFFRAGIGPFIVITASGDEEIAADAFRHGAADYIEKSVAFADPERLKAVIRGALRRDRLEQANRTLARQLKLANVELHKKNETLAGLTETAHRFVDDVAHEFRTPLAVVAEFASILEDGIGGPVNEKQVVFLRHITDATRDLAHLVDDFLDTGKLRARTLRVDRSRHDVTDIVEACRATLTTRAKARRVGLEFDVAPDLPAVRADGEKVRRTLVNLAINAIKFTAPDTTVTVRARAEGASGVRLSVIDHGAGMPPVEVQRLFDRFRQGTDGRAADMKGFGLGLHIVRELATLNLGTVDVESAPGEGSTFSFTLPADEPTAIVDAFIARMRERTPDGRASALVVRRTGAWGPFADLASFMSSIAHATDLVLPVAADEVVMLGETIEPDCWRDRVRARAAEAFADRPEDERGHVEVRVRGPWRPDEERRAFLELLHVPSELAHCA